MGRTHLKDNTSQHNVATLTPNSVFLVEISEMKTLTAVGLFPLLKAVEAAAPPIDWMTRDRMSHVQNTIVSVTTR